ncbi:hypothetical protein K474DRAFT_976933 [Panus rudis PR-1116 ss-1]|nr:hypothetical protein K474DRAFT_976933 [Panus rudis PR-1116 ss-1]
MASVQVVGFLLSRGQSYLYFPARPCKTKDSTCVTFAPLTFLTFPIPITVAHTPESQTTKELRNFVKSCIEENRPIFFVLLLAASLAESSGPFPDPSSSGLGRIWIIICTAAVRCVYRHSL